jgi:hypothetical protein
MIFNEYHYSDLVDFEEDQNIGIMLEQHVYSHHALGKVMDESKY